MAKPFYALVLALLLSTSGVLSSAFSQSINVETNSAIQSPSEEEALKEAAELIRQSRGSEGLAAAERGLARLLKAYSDSSIAALLATLLDGVREKRAEVDLSIAMYYLYNRSAYQAAEVRLEGIKSEYPNYSRLDEVLYHLALLQIETGRSAEAEVTLQGLLNRPRFNARARDAKEKLEALRSGK